MKTFANYRGSAEYHATYNRDATRAQKKIARIAKLEERARGLRDRLDDVELEWEKLHESVRNTPEWKSYCDANGSVYDYNFGDILC